VTPASPRGLPTPRLRGEAHAGTRDCRWLARRGRRVCADESTDPLAPAKRAAVSSASGRGSMIPCLGPSPRSIAIPGPRVSTTRRGNATTSASSLLSKLAEASSIAGASSKMSAEGPLTNTRSSRTARYSRRTRRKRGSSSSTSGVEGTDTPTTSARRGRNASRSDPLADGRARALARARLGLVSCL
jgi:hypothetical protein